MKADVKDRRIAALEEAGRYKRLRDDASAVAAYLEAASYSEVPEGDLCLNLSRCYKRMGDAEGTAKWAIAAVDSGQDFSTWQAAAALLPASGSKAWPSRRTARLALLGSYTTQHFVPLLRLAAARFGIDLDIHEAPYGQYRQEILNPESAAWRFAPDVVLLALNARDINLPEYSANPEHDLDLEVQRWTDLWSTIASRSKAAVVQHNFALPPEAPFGHLGAKLAGTRVRMSAELNRRLAAAAGESISLVDCDWLSSLTGKLQWFDSRYWHSSKQAVALASLPLLARHTAAVLAARLGLSKKCLVLDLDNTLWGGVIGEDGISGIRIGHGAEGEAFSDFHDYILQLKNKGVILAVCSKNDDAVAREPFEKHEGMKLRVSDFAIFVANWRTKPENLRYIASTLNIGLDSLVFVDDNPMERAAVRSALPEIEVIALPEDPSGYAQALASYPMFETCSFTAEDARRSEQYAAKAAIAAEAQSATSIEDFYRGLHMKAVVQPITEETLPRISQLVGKTNQFNLTTRRHSLEQLRAFSTDPRCVHFSLKLSDRFADHGLVALMIAFQDGETLNIDTWLMSCRVIGRTVEAEMLKRLCQEASARGCSLIRGEYIATAKNNLVKDLYESFCFHLLDETEGVTRWEYNLKNQPAIDNSFIEEVHDVPAKKEETAA